ncbi:DGQHR domain-containing protein [Rheinheimera mesophila]|uniref:DGQHR domain-containing protein n=1 Tax=Rheinheimera mesophila TaxID=1547515 RepID=A0A3P3QNE1_9GAMM|nr:DNA sulfur modification protein DndB [Rheinheimera mesophila]RRJ22751.1 DGQHR domain-containing protein [Rheinheimera mesophila]
MSTQSLDKNFNFRIPAVIGQQSGRPYYIATVPFRMLSRLIDFDTGSVLERSQRKTDPGRANAIIRYLLENQKNGFVLPPLVGNVDSEEMYFENSEDRSVTGYLNIPMDAQIKLMDGQHRATAIIAAIKESPALAQETIAIQLFKWMSVKERQQAFSDINSNAKSVSRSLNLAYNHRDSQLAVLAKEIGYVHAWSGKIDRDRNAANPKLGSLFSYKHVVAASTLLLGLKKAELPAESSINFVSRWWNAIAGAVGWEEQTIDPEKVSNTAVGLMSLSRLGFMVFQAEQSGTSVDLYQIAEKLREIDWNKSSSFWQDVLVSNEKMIVGKNAEQSAAAAMADLLSITKGAEA